MQFLKIAGVSFIVVGLALSMAGLIIFGNNLPATRTYDCGMAEWHPDIPEKVKEECRKIKRTIV